LIWIEAMTKAAIILAGALVAAAILVTGHWQVVVSESLIFRLDRWTGRVVACNQLAGLAEAAKGREKLPLFWDIPCTSERPLPSNNIFDQLDPRPSANEFFPKR
jgi:hypothetical protein